MYDGSTSSFDFTTMQVVSSGHKRAAGVPLITFAFQEILGNRNPVHLFFLMTLSFGESAVSWDFETGRG